MSSAAAAAALSRQSRRVATQVDSPGQFNCYLYILVRYFLNSGFSYVFLICISKSRAGNRSRWQGTKPLRAPEATTAAAMAALSWIFWRGRHQVGTCVHPAGSEAAWSRV